jgi:hypothetical protein
MSTARWLWISAALALACGEVGPGTGGGGGSGVVGGGGGGAGGVGGGAGGGGGGGGSLGGGGGGVGGGGGGGGGASSAGGGSGSSDGGWPTVVYASTACPHVVLGSDPLPMVYHGSTVGLPDWVSSTRLEWTSAPDDSLRFVAPSLGAYTFAITSPAGTLGVTIKNEDGSLHQALGCPAPGATFVNDGVFETPVDPTPLDAGQTVLLWISTPSWAPDPGDYTLTISSQ